MNRIKYSWQEALVEFLNGKDIYDLDDDEYLKIEVSCELSMAHECDIFYSEIIDVK